MLGATLAICNPLALVAGRKSVHCLALVMARSMLADHHKSHD
jgi:hypothetical protein